MTSVTAGYGTTGRSTRSLARSLNPAILTPAIGPGRDGTAMSHTAAAARSGSAGPMPPWYEHLRRWHAGATFVQDAAPRRQGRWHQAPGPERTAHDEIPG